MECKAEKGGVGVDSVLGLQSQEVRRTWVLGFSGYDAARLEGISPNLTWLKWLAIAAMLFDHAAWGVLASLHLDAGASLWRLPGRISIPFFAFLIAFNYNFFTRDKKKFVLRLWLFAALSEPLYCFYFGCDGNAFLPLAIGSTFLLASEAAATDLKKYLLCAVFTLCCMLSLFSVWSFAVMLVASLVWLFSVFVKSGRLLLLLPIYLLMLLCNQINWIFAAVLLATLAPIVAALKMDAGLPSLGMNKWVGYCFYPGHLILLILVFRPL